MHATAFPLVTSPPEQSHSTSNVIAGIGVDLAIPLWELQHWLNVPGLKVTGRC